MRNSNGNFILYFKDTMEDFLSSSEKRRREPHTGLKISEMEYDAISTRLSNSKISRNERERLEKELKILEEDDEVRKRDSGIHKRQRSNQ